MIGLVLTAGGARGAYQAGVLKRIGEIQRLRNQPSPFSIIAGASAGAINGAALASGSEDYSLATEHLTQLWSQLKVHQVFKTDGLSLSLGSMRWLHDLSLGGLIGSGGAQSFLDFSPLRELLLKHLSLQGIGASIEKRL